MKTLMIVDGYMYVYTSLYSRIGHELTAPSGEVTTATFVFTKIILKLLKNYQPDMLCVAMDSRERTFRKDLYPEYKANRSYELPQHFAEQLTRITEILTLMNIPVFYVPGFEADDIIGTVAEKAYQQGDIFTSICSRDKDMIQLINDRTDIVHINKGLRFDAKRIVEKWGISPSQFIDFLAFQGDSADNVPGVHGVGPKIAVELLKEWDTSEEIYKYLDIIGGKLSEKLEKGKDMFDLCKKLVTIKKDVPMDIDFEALKVSEYDNLKLDKLFDELGFVSLCHPRTKSGRPLF